MAERIRKCTRRAGRPSSLDQALERCAHAVPFLEHEEYCGRVDQLHRERYRLALVDRIHRCDQQLTRPLVVASGGNQALRVRASSGGLSLAARAPANSVGAFGDLEREVEEALDASVLI